MILDQRLTTHAVIRGVIDDEGVGLRHCPALIEDTAALLHAYDWPGNVRELENVCRWLTVMAPAREIHLEDLPPELQGSYLTAEADQNWESNLRTWADYYLATGETDLLSQAVPTFERILLEAALKKTGGRRQDTAKLLGWGRNTLTRKLKKVGMDL